MTKRVSTLYLANILTDASNRTMQLVEGLTDQQIIGPKLPIVNPLLWEIGHVAWFYELFILRMLYKHNPIIENGDNLYDSIDIEHYDRWNLPILDLKSVKTYIKQVREKLIERLGVISESSLASRQDSFIYQFATFHEDMHTEAYTYSRNTLNYPKPYFRPCKSGDSEKSDKNPVPKDIEIPGGTFKLGASREANFLFDNEKWAHKVTIYPFKISPTCVTNLEFLAFVSDGGYERRDLWHDIGWNWRQQQNASYPVYWIPDGSDTWLMRYFSDTIELPSSHPVIHINWYEASAFCKWAERRLPSEIEWEVAASTEPINSGREFSSNKRIYPWGDDPKTIRRANLDGHKLGTVDVAAFSAGDSAWGARQMLEMCGNGRPVHLNLTPVSSLIHTKNILNLSSEREKF